jgi:hypothetical protein
MKFVKFFFKKIQYKIIHPKMSRQTQLALQKVFKLPIVAIFFISTMVPERMDAGWG